MDSTTELFEIIAESIVKISHLLKVMTTYAWVKHGLFLTSYQPYRNVITDKIK